MKMNSPQKIDIKKQIALFYRTRLIVELSTVLIIILFFITYKELLDKPSYLTSFGFLDSFVQIWTGASLIIGAVRATIEIREYIKTEKIYQVLPIAPTLILTVVFLFIEFLSSLAIYILISYRQPLAQKYFIVISFITITVLEIIRRIPKIKFLFHGIISFVDSFINAILGELKSSWLSIFYFLITSAFVVYGWILLRVGLNSPLDNIPTSATDLFSNVLTLTTAVIAIFFAGATLAIELIVGVYSFKFITVILRNLIFLSGFLIMLGIISSNLVLMRFGWNESLANLSFISSIYVVLSLIPIAGLIIKYIQVPNVIKTISKGIQREIEKAPKPKSIMSSPMVTMGNPGFRSRIWSTFNNYLTGKDVSPATSSLASYRKVEAFKKELIEKIRPLFTASQKAILEDRREIVLVCLDEIRGITKTYMTVYRSIHTSDEVHLFLVSQFKIMFDISVTAKNQQYTSDIVAAVVLLGKDSLFLTTNNENRIASAWSRFLANSIVKSWKLEYTSAQMSACDGIIEIGIDLINRLAYKTVLYGVSNYLKEVGETLANLRHTWSITIAYRICIGLFKLLIEYVSVARKTRTHYPYFIELICRHLDEVIGLLYKKDGDKFLLAARISDIVADQYDNENLSSMVSIILSDWPDPPSQVEHSTLKGLFQILILIRNLSREAIQKEGNQIEAYCGILAEVSWNLINFIQKVKNKFAHQEAEKDLNFLVNISQEVIQQMSKLPYNNYEALEQLSLIQAFLAYYAHVNNQEFFLNLFIGNFKELLELLDREAETGDDRISTINTLYILLKRYGAWLYHFSPNHNLIRTALRVLRKHDYLDYSFEEAYIGFSEDTFSEKLQVFSLRKWETEAITIIDTLNSGQIYKDFDVKIKTHRTGKRKA